MRAEALTDEEKCNSDYKIEYERLQHEQQQLQKELNDIQELLARYKGSLYEWLTKNKLQWENTIGKVVDEERVLYAQGLSPMIEKETATLYGVKIDVSQLEPMHCSPEEYRKQVKELQEKIEAVSQKNETLFLSKEQNIRKISERLSEKIRPIKQEITNYRVRLEQIPIIIRDKQTELDTFERREQEERILKTTERRHEYDEVVLKLSQAKKESRFHYSLYDG